MQYNQQTLRRLQLAELGILEDVDRVCREHGITYFLDSGTVLGARRHGGFIPWDDDIDIGMPRADYEKFLEIAPIALDDRYCVTTPHTNERQAALFAKVMLAGTRFETDETQEAGFNQGVFIDVFPYDALCEDSFNSKRQRRRCLLWQSLSYLNHSQYIVVPHNGALGTVERIGCRIAHRVVKMFFSVQRINAGFDAAATMARGNRETQWLISSAYASDGPFPVDILLPPSEIEFEGRSFPAPADVEGYLRVQYGETWDQLPPEDQRRNHAPKVLDLGDCLRVKG